MCWDKTVHLVCGGDGALAIRVSFRKGAQSTTAAPIRWIQRTNGNSQHGKISCNVLIVSLCDNVSRYNSANSSTASVALQGVRGGNGPMVRQRIGTRL